MTSSFRSIIFIVSSLALCLAITGSCFAGTRCDPGQLIEVRSLGKLPDAIRALLPRATRGLDGIADRGGQFNATDVIDESQPMRRFTPAAVGTTCAVIAVEHGGFVPGFDVAEYRLTAAGWQLGG